MQIKYREKAKRKRSEARVFGQSFARGAGSNLAGGMDVCVVFCSKRQNDKMQDSQDRNK